MIPADQSTTDPQEGGAFELAWFEEIESRLRPFRQAWGADTLSEYAFDNLYLFRHTHAYRYLPGPYPCIAGVTYDGVRHLMPLFDLNEAPASVLENLLCAFDCFYPIPAAVAQQLDPAYFCLSESTDDADYIYPVVNFLEYRGALLRKKRGLMAQLTSAFHLDVRALGLASIMDAETVLKGWMRDKVKAPGQADEAPCEEALRRFPQLGLEGFVYYADGIPAGFLIAQTLSPSTVVIRFAKGIDAYKGIYQYMFHHYCMTKSAEIEWVNFEQDLGLPNFRQTKRSYQPSSLLRKYRVRLKA